MRLRLPMMMFGTYTRYRSDGDGPPSRAARRKQRITHREEAGDTGFFPSVNHIYMQTYRGGRKLTPPAEALKARWQQMAREACEANGWQMTSKQKVVVDCWFHFPDHRARDTSNVFKLLMDSLEGIVFDNDYYALPRVQDFKVIEKGGEAPYIELEFRLKEEEGRGSEEDRKDLRVADRPVRAGDRKRRQGAKR